MGAAYLDKKDFNKAIFNFTKVLEIDTNMSDAYKGLSQAYKGIGDEKTANEYEVKYFKHAMDELYNNMIKK
jgi:Tfp pilus assembly protein PilF